MRRQSRQQKTEQPSFADSSCLRSSSSNSQKVPSASSKAGIVSNQAHRPTQRAQQMLLELDDRSQYMILRREGSSYIRCSRYLRRIMEPLYISWRFQCGRTDWRCDIERAIHEYQPLLAINPNRVDARSNLGAAYARLGRYQDAIAQYKSRRREEKAAKNQAAEAISPRMILGVGKATRIDSLEFKWTGGRVDKLTNLPLNK